MTAVHALLWSTAVSALVGIAVMTWRLRRGYAIITVDGGSMLPTLHSGDRVLMRYGRRRLRQGQIVVIACPDRDRGWRDCLPITPELGSRRWCVKRAVALAGDWHVVPVGSVGGVVPAGHLIVIGDNPYSQDSRKHGPCPEHQVLGVVVRRLRRATVQATDVEAVGW